MPKLKFTPYRKGRRPRLLSLPVFLTETGEEIGSIVFNPMDLVWFPDGKLQDRIAEADKISVHYSLSGLKHELEARAQACGVKAHPRLRRKGT